MKNSDMPAMPLTGDAYTNFAHYDGTKNTSYDPQCQGLTKREYFAGLAMQGWLARCSEVPHSVKLDPESMANVAVDMADALLKELDR